MSATSTLADTTTTAATAKLAKQVAELAKVAESFHAIVEGNEDLVHQILEKEAKLASLDTKFAEEARARLVDLELSFKEREADKVTEILGNTGKVAVNKQEYDGILSAFNALKADFTKKLETEAAIIRNQEAAKSSAAIQTARLELQVKEANNLAAIETLKDKIALLEDTIDDYKAQIAADRDARVREAQARGVPAVTVNSGK